MSAAGLFGTAWASGWRPERQLAIDEWADLRRILTPRSAAEPGPWRTARFPHTREIMIALSPASPIRRVVWMASRQMAKTEVMLNMAGHSIECSPGPMLFVQPTVEMMKKVSRQRVSPMLEETPELRAIVRPARSRDSGNTMLVKESAGGILIMTGANSSASLRSMPVRRLLADEVDEYPRDVDDQGDALAIAEACTSNFPNRKIFITGNPGVRGHSRIESEFMAGDQRRFHIACPACGHFDYLTWDGRDWYEARAGVHHRIAWDKDADKSHLPETAHMVCSGCGAAVGEAARTSMLEGGQWRATSTALDGETASFHISSLYSPAGFKSWADCARQFLAAKQDPGMLRAFINHVLGETWEERADAAEASDLLAKERLDTYGAEVPDGVGILVAACDVQGDRLAYVVKGYGAGEESWLIEWGEIQGDPKKDRVFFDLDATVLQRAWTNAVGREFRVERLVVDSGGHHTDEVYAYCKTRGDRGVYAIKGGSEVGRPLVGIATAHNRYRTPLFVLCTDTGKAAVIGRLRIGAPGPGYIHLPAGVDPEYVHQLTAERAIYRWSAGRSVRVWKKKRERNEAFDLEVYALAALKMLGEAFIQTLAERAARAAAPLADKATTSAPGPPTRQRPSWVKRW